MCLVQAVDTAWPESRAAWSGERASAAAWSDEDVMGAAWSDERVAGQRSPREFNRDDAELEIPALDGAQMRKDPKHRPVVGENVRRETVQAARLGGGEERVEQNAAEAAVLPAVFDDDGDLRGTGPVAWLIARHRP